MQADDYEVNTNAPKAESPKVQRFFDSSNSPLMAELGKVNAVTAKTIHLGTSNKTLSKPELSVLDKKIINCLMHNSKPQSITTVEYEVLKPAIVMSYIIMTKFPRLLSTRQAFDKHASSLSKVDEIELTCSTEAVQRLWHNLLDNKLNAEETIAAEIIIHQYCNTVGKPLPGFEKIAGVSKRKPITFEMYKAVSDSPYIKEFLKCPTIQEDGYSAVHYANSFLAFAQPAILYGAANCDGFAALAMRNLLKLVNSSAEVCNQIRNVCICSIDNEHIFIAVNMDRLNDKRQFIVTPELSANKNCIVMDAYYNFVLPYDKALEELQNKYGYKGVQIVCHAFLDELKKFVKVSETKKILKKLDESHDAKLIAKHARELQILSAKFDAPKKQNESAPAPK